MDKETQIQDIEIESSWNIGDVIKKGKDYSWSRLLDIIEDLNYEYEVLKEEYKEFKQDVEDNYKPISANEMYE